MKLKLVTTDHELTIADAEMRHGRYSLDYCKRHAPKS